MKRLIITLLLASWFTSVAAETVACDAFASPVADRATSLLFPAAALFLNIEIVSQPQHGTLGDPDVDVTTQFYGCKTYTPDPGYTGPDSFTWRPFKTDDADAPIYTYRLLVRPMGDPTGLHIKLVVRDWLYAELQGRIDTLRDTMAAEGYTTDLRLWESGSARDLWDELVADYLDPDIPLIGAMLIGSLPQPENGDWSYWNMACFDDPDTSMRQNIWVSRIGARDSVYGDEVDLIARAIDANLAYRTGRSRLRDAAAMVNAYDAKQDMPVYQRIWDSEDIMWNRTVTDSMRRGDAFTHRSDHNAPIGSSGLFNLSNQLRVACISGCNAGSLFDSVSQYQHTRGGGNVVSMASQETTGWGNFRLGPWLSKDDNDLADRLDQGESLGLVLLEAATWKYYDLLLPSGTFVYGDLSLSVAGQPHNIPPVLTELQCSTSNPLVGETVSFALDVSDPDADADESPFVDYEYQAEWWFEGIQYHRLEPGVTEHGTEATWSPVQEYSYVRAHTYTARVEVVDEWMARSWQTVRIRVRPDSSQPLRVNCGAGRRYDRSCPLGDQETADGRVWLHDQGFETGTWGHAGDSGGNPQTSGSAVSGTDHQIPYRYWRRVRKTDKDQLWRFPVSTGDYRIVLHFADMTSSAAGESLLDAWLEGEQILDAFDAYAEAGPATAITRSFTRHIDDGEIILALRRDADATANAFINAIEIIPTTTQTRTILMEQPQGHVWSIAPVHGSEETQGSTQIFSGLAPATTYSLTPLADGNG